MISGSRTTADADAESSALITIYEDDAALLEKLPPRKEMRRSRDLVRLSSERIDDRALALDTPWFSTDSGSDSDVEDKSEADAEEIGSGADSGDSEEDADDVELGVASADEVENDDDEDAEEDEVPHSSSALKRKRPPPPSSEPSSKSQSGPTRPRKKVTFAITVKATTKSTRSKDHTLSRPSAPPSKRSNAKAPAGTKPPPPPRARKFAANAPPPTSKKREAAATGEDDAYDFGKFF